MPEHDEIKPEHVLPDIDITKQWELWKNEELPPSQPDSDLGQDSGREPFQTSQPDNDLDQDSGEDSVETVENDYSSIAYGGLGCVISMIGILPGFIYCVLLGSSFGVAVLFGIIFGILIGVLVVIAYDHRSRRVVSAVETEFEPEPFTLERWYGIISLACGVIASFPFLYYYIVGIFIRRLPCWEWLRDETLYLVVFYTLANGMVYVGPFCGIAGVVFGILGRNTEGRFYAYTGLVLSILFGGWLLLILSNCFWWYFLPVLITGTLLDLVLSRSEKRKGLLFTQPNTDFDQQV